jgi:c-di-GMP-binding flagellar brake protein YcgR
MNRPEEHESPLNKRRCPRYELETELRATVFGAEQRGVMRGRSLNISETGIAGVFTTGWDVGTAVSLEFSVLVTSKPVRVEGVVRSHTDYRYGFEFVDLMPDQRELIGKTCRTLALLQ